MSSLAPQLSPTPQGYTILGLVQPHTSLPAGGWMLQLMSDVAMPPLQDAPVLRALTFDGEYVTNTRLVVCRCADLQKHRRTR